MANRYVLWTSFSIAALIVASGFFETQLFYFELAKSSAFIAIGVLVYFGENRYSYMLGAIFPPLWFLVDILVGSFLADFRDLFGALIGRGVDPLATPLDAVARLGAVLLFFLCVHAWRREVSERFWGRTLSAALVISLIYVGVLSAWYIQMFPATAHIS